MPLIIVLLLSVLAADLTSAAARPSARDGRFASLAKEVLVYWEDHDLVCLGERHGSLDDAAVRRALILDPVFPEVVDVVLLEFVNPVHQRLLDRWLIDGAEVAPSDLQPIWRDAGRGVAWEAPQYEDLLVTLRQVNLALPATRRVRAVGAALPIDWIRIGGGEDLLPFRDRSGYLRDLMRREVLDRQGRKGLAVFGSGHCERWGAGFRAALEEEYPGRIWSILPLSRQAVLAAAHAPLPIEGGARLVSITGTPLAQEPAGGVFFEGHSIAGATLGQVTDAILYYGVSGQDEIALPDVHDLEPGFAREVNRRDRLWDERLD